ncbi:Mog1p/PsbP-like protein [Neoconidiobolus thromboides FSU 785]|nr:Mog1p/PsbP-like protein [Neoconidiobolus thromboides FSU 785]
MISTKLFGGAIEMSIFDQLVDLSQFREVPNHQEVFADQTEENRSLIIEINELSKDVKDEESVNYHFQEICDLNQVESFTIEDVKEIDSNEIQGLSQDSKVYILKGNQVIKERGGNVINLLFYLALFRLKKVDSDLLISFHQPILDNNSILNKDTLFFNMIKSFKIKDWKLFG